MAKKNVNKAMKDIDPNDVKDWVDKSIKILKDWLK